MAIQDNKTTGKAIYANICLLTFDTEPSQLKENLFKDFQDLDHILLTLGSLKQ